jgi:hypothetical protein
VSAAGAINRGGHTPAGAISGIRDIAVKTGKPSGFPPAMSHTKYWAWPAKKGNEGKLETPDHIVTLRKVLGLK